MARKLRSDIGKRRKRYAKKPTRRYQRIRFKKTSGHKTHLKLWVWEKRRMSFEGRRRFSEKVRPYMKPIVYKFGDRIDVPVGEISNRERVEQWAEERIGYAGDFLIMSISRSFRNKKGYKWVKLFSIIITEHPTGLKARLIRNWRGFRYWFWEK